MSEQQNIKVRINEFFNHKATRVAAILIVLFSVGFVSFTYGAMHPKQIVVKGLTNVGDKDAKADFGLFWEVYQKMKGVHLYGEKYDEQEGVYGAISGMVNSSEDPYTIFLKPVESKKFEEDVRGLFGGIGAEIANKNGHVVVVAPLDESPAAKAGLKPEDIIYKVDGESMEGVDVGDAVTKIRGPVGTIVKLEVFRFGETPMRIFEITREIIKVQSTRLYFVGPNKDIAHLRILTFNENLPESFMKDVQAMASHGTNGIIIDLRNDPGGFLEVAVAIAGYFVDPGKIVVTEEFRSGKKDEFKAAGNPILRDIPMVLLVNGGSASASEILAGALRDHLGSKVVGEKTFGKGTVQELQELSDGKSKLKVTVAHWRLPKGDIIDKNGIVPTDEVKISEEDAKAGKDTQLEKATELVLQAVAAKTAKAQ